MHQDPDWVRPTSSSSSISSSSSLKQSLMAHSVTENGRSVAAVIPVTSQPTYNNRSAIIQIVFRIATMMMCLLMISTALIGLSQMQASATEVGKFFVAVYMLFFAGLLFCFEIIQLRRITYLDHVYRRNLGFLYSAYGKAFYIIL